MIPCHRLVGQDRSLTGFGLGLWRKRWLLEHEGIYPIPKVAPKDGSRTRQVTLDQAVPRRARKARGSPTSR
jgi:alkylated DNA nucleotide flippase Atl1